MSVAFPNECILKHHFDKEIAMKRIAEIRRNGAYIARMRSQTPIHQLGDGFFPVADELEQLCRDEGDRLRVIQFHTAGQSLLGEKADLVQREFVEFAWGKVHSRSTGISPVSSL